MKPKLRKFMHTVEFFLILALLTGLCSWVLEPRGYTAADGVAYPEVYGYRALPDNTVDVAVIGDSNVYCAFSPMVLWSEYGAASYVSGEPRQHIESSLRLLKNYYTCQSPKLVLLEVDELFEADNSFLSSLGIRLEEDIPAVKYHSNWKNVRLSTLFTPRQDNYSSSTMGQYCEFAARAYTGGDYMSDSGPAVKIPRAARHALDAFADLCSEHGSRLVLLSVPCPASWNRARHDAVQAYADQRGLTYLDLNGCAAVGIDWSKDTSDQGIHLNFSGSKAVTEYIGSCLAADGDLTDRRGSPAYSAWDDDCALFRGKHPGLL